MEKITLFGIVAMVMLVVTAASAAALTVSPAQLQIGDTNARASNPQSSTVDAKNLYMTGTITITNDANTPVNSLRLGTVVPKLGFQNSDLQVNATFAATTLAVNASTTATITARMPEKLNAVDSTTLAETAFNVADFNVLATNASDPNNYVFTATSQLLLQRRNELNVKEVEVCVNDNCKTVRDGGTVENLRPGDSLDVKVVIENRYSTGDREDLDIEDSDLEIMIDDDDFDEEDSTTLSSISADGETEESFSFDVTDDVRDGTYKMEVTVSGRDELGAFMGEAIEVRLKVQRDAHDIEIRRSSVAPSTFPCSSLSTTGRTGRVTVSAANIGRQDESKVAFEVYSAELGIKERVESLRMDRDNSRTETMAFTVPSTAKPGTYQLSVKSFFDNTAQSDVVQVPIVISECGAGVSTTTTSTTPPPSTTTTTTTQPNDGSAALNAELLARISSLQNEVESIRDGQQQPVPSDAVPVPERKTTSEPTKSTALPWVSGFANSGLYIALLSGVIVLIIIVLIALIVKFIAPKP